MPTPAYIKIVGQTQGNITAGAFTADSVGNVFQQGHEDQILVQEIKHEVTTPTDPQSGQPSGQRVHKPFIFTSSLNKATPLMYQHLPPAKCCQRSRSAGIAPRRKANKSIFFTTTLEDATIVSINTVLPHALDKDNENYTQLVEVSLAYRKITWLTM